MTNRHRFLFAAFTLASALAFAVPMPLIDAAAPELTADVRAANRRIAAAVRARHSAVELYPAATVGFARDVALDERLTSLLASRYERELAALPAPTPELLPVDQATLARIFGQPAQLQLAYSLSPSKVSHAARTPLIREGATTLSIQDVLHRQNVQGRMEFFSHNLPFMHAQGKKQIASLRVHEWASKRLGAAALAELRQALADQDDVHAGMTLYGLGPHAETESAVQARLARQVTQSDINAWYAAHRDQFKRVEKVRVRHITAATESEARKALAEAAGGARFDTLAKRYSQAPDAQRGGLIGWVKQTADPDWLAALALSQPVGIVSGPFRTPVGPAESAQWEILLVEARVEGHHPSDSETVRYEARKAIAAARAREQFAALSKP